MSVVKKREEKILCPHVAKSTNLVHKLKFVSYFLSIFCTLRSKWHAHVGVRTQNVLVRFKEARCIISTWTCWFTRVIAYMIQIKSNLVQICQSFLLHNLNRIKPVPDVTKQSLFWNIICFAEKNKVVNIWHVKLFSGIYLRFPWNLLDKISFPEKTNEKLYPGGPFFI